jgi:hypothetical protein
MLLGAAGGWALSKYCGALILIPGVVAFLLVIVIKKTGLGPWAFAGAIAVTAGHLAWFLAGAFMAGAWSSVIYDVVLLSAGILWLWLRPGLGPVIFLGVIQLAAIAIHLMALPSATFGDSVHRALTAHGALRVISIVCLVAGYLKFRKERAASSSTETATAE